MKTVAWLLVVPVIVGALAVGAGGDRGPRTETERVNAIASEVRCPTCRGLSAAESDAATAAAIREEIRERLRAGESPDEIRAYLVTVYDEDILLRPGGEGLAALVWVLPVVAVLLAGGALALAFRRWRGPYRGPTERDRELVEEALR